ncbi:GNAT family N-acetyltransferase [Streptomyces sp. NPDC051771]|uniref:GNAT family N-acetyltransferase n=1 Tax=Streptomyces sp. NPDC051771 TaxID=3154847 RepID=UPI00343F3235
MAERQQGEPEIRDVPERGRLEAYADGVFAGVIVYFALDAEPHALVAVHTVVDADHEGRGIAGALVREFYAMAARRGVPVVPLCPYAAKWARRHPEEAPPVSAEVTRAAQRQLAATPGLW